MHPNAGPLIVKANGEREPFRPDKLYHSLVHSGADTDHADAITGEIAGTVQEGEHTTDIYRRAFAKLRKLERPIAARYSVKRALLDLGPSGYPFEDFVGEIFRVQGFQTSNRRMVPGRCVEHELDLIAIRDDQRIGAEAKFHNNPGLKSDIKVALYVQARFEDIRAGAERDSDHDFTSRMIITNTKFTEQAIVYAECVGLDLLAWDHPRSGNLREMIEETGVHPVSCLTSLSRANKQHLMSHGVVLCRQVKEQPEVLDGLGLSEQTMEGLFKEMRALCRM